MKRKKNISIIIPVYNSEKKLRELFSSLLKSSFTDFEVILNDSPRTTDATGSVVDTFKKQGLTIIYLKKNSSMAQARRVASDYAIGEILLHIDSDMQVTKGLLAEINDLTSKQYDALVIPEESIGTTFWARCKWLEKKCYDDVPEMQSLRGIKRSVYESVGGHDKRMIFSEDKDLDLRVRNAGYSVGITKHRLLHDEGALSLWNTCKKKLQYSHTANLFLAKHPKEALWQANIFNRYFIFLKHFRYFFQYPFLYLGMIYMKNCEFICGAIGYVRQKYAKDY